MENLCISFISDEEKAQKLVEGRTKGLAEGLAKGKIIGRIETLHEDGKSLQDIADRLKMKKEEVEKILKELKRI